MHIDAITLAAIADEWRLLLTRARIDNIIQPTVHSIAIQCYAPAQEQEQGGKNRWLYLSAHPQLARAHITALKPSRIVNEPPSSILRAEANILRGISSARASTPPVIVRPLPPWTLL